MPPPGCWHLTLGTMPLGAAVPGTGCHKPALASSPTVPLPLQHPIRFNIPGSRAWLSPGLCPHRAARSWKRQHPLPCTFEAEGGVLPSTELRIPKACLVSCPPQHPISKGSNGETEGVKSQVRSKHTVGGTPRGDSIWGSENVS